MTTVWSARPAMTRSVPAVALALAATLLAACSGDDDAAPGPDPAASSATASGSPGAPAPMATKATIRTVTGNLSPSGRAQLRDKVGAAVDRWFEAAYLGGDYPRTDFGDAFDAFSAGARERAEQDRKLMSNAAVGQTTYAVRPLARRVKIDALAPGGRPAGVTVQFRLGLLREGETGNEVRERVSGTLFLTFRAGDGWRVFGYDVQRGAL